MDKLDKCFGQQGWKEFHRNRKDILAEFDKILEQISNRPVKVAHGIGVEAFLRKWLAEFLPNKFGVTSGYIIPNLYDDSAKLYHFDIIIYNRLDAPVLWTEGNEDDSEQGKYRAIPARHVMAVYEVKSRFTSKNIKDALAKLSQTKEFRAQLNKHYSCGIIFVDLKECENNDGSIIKDLYRGTEIHGFSGGVVLRFEGDDTSTGLIRIGRVERADETDGEEPPKSEERLTPLAKPIDDLAIHRTEAGDLESREPGAGVTLTCTAENTWSVTKSYNILYGEDLLVSLSWSRSNFSEFCIDLISRLDGLAYNDQNRPSFGRIFDSVDTKKAIPQSSEPLEGKPFVLATLKEVRNGESVFISFDDSPPFVELGIQLENKGAVEVVFSDDGFHTSNTLAPGQSASTVHKLEIRPSSDKVNIRKLIDSIGLEIPFRVVYRTSENGSEFFAIEKKVKIIRGESSLDDI